MQLLIDTDLFCKLVASDLLEDATHLFGVELSMCRRLAALPYMLQRGRLVTLFGPTLCETILHEVHKVPAIDSVNYDLTDQLTQIESIDPGEAQIFGLAAANDQTLVLTGDKRALKALKNVPNFLVLLNGRIVVFEAILLALCQAIGVEEVCRRVQSISTLDQMVKICFPYSTIEPVECLESYFNNLSSEFSSPCLWKAST